MARARQRDNFTRPIIKHVAARVGYRCALCDAPTSGPGHDKDKSVNLGVAAHITAAAPGGPRWDSSLTPEQRKSPDNAIWLCQNCGKLVDSDAAGYTVDKLRQMKEQAEQRAQASLVHSRAHTSLTPSKPYVASELPPQGSAGRETDATPKLEVNIGEVEEFDFVSLIPAFSSEALNQQPDRTTLFVRLSDVQVINHDINPTEIQSVHLSVWNSQLKETLPLIEILEEEFIGSRRIEARSQRRFRLKFTLVFDSVIKQDETNHVLLHLKAIGLGEARIRLPFSTSAPRSRVTPPSLISSNLIGRDDVFQSLLTKLRDNDSVQVIGIWGMGGIGKTFLASRVAQRLLDDPHGFSALIPIESRSARLSTSSQDSEEVTYGAILDKILGRMGCQSLLRLNQNEKETEVRKILMKHRLLLFVDNLETTEDNLAVGTRALITLFSGTQSKALLVSRFALECDHVHLEELAHEDACEYVRWRIQRVGARELDSTTVRKVAESVGGSPFAIELVVGLISKLPKTLPTPEREESIQSILERVTNLRVKNQHQDDPSMQFFLDIFWLSWNKKSEANMLILDLVGTSPTHGKSLKFLQDQSKRDRDIISEELQELYELALVNIASHEDETVFFLHPLTDAWVRFKLLELDDR